MIRRLGLIFCLATGLAGSPVLSPAAYAETALITIEPAPSPPVRSESPFVFVWKVRSQSSSLIEGQLDVTIHDGPEVLAHAVLEDVVVSAGEQLFRTVLPPVESNNQLNTVDVRVAFISRNQKLGEHDVSLRAPNQWQRSLAVLICDPWQSGITNDKKQLVERLRIENWNAEPADKTINTIPAHVRPEDLPADPLGFCGFDIALLAQEGFSEMKQGQLQAALDWVEAGGSLCLVPGDGVLKDYHQAFLAQAAHSAPDDPLFALDSTGRLPMPEGSQGDSPSAILRRHGLGRLAIIPGKLDRYLAGPETELRRMAAFLWKMRRDRLDEFLRSGKFLVKVEIEADKSDPRENQWHAYNRNASYANLRPKDNQLATLPLQSGDQLLGRLMPKGLQVVPMSLIALILVVYVVLIGPADWIVLGAIKRRKWTWFTFPAVTIGLTLATVWLAEWYMSVGDNRRTVVFYDLGEGGKIARRNRFEVLFQGSERQMSTDISRELFSAMTLQRFSSGTWANYQQMQMSGVDQRRRYTQVANYSGHVPARYTVTQFVSQWTPQLNRRLAIAPTGEQPVDFNWNAFADASVFHPGSVVAGAVRDDLVKQLKQAFGESVNVAVIAAGKRHTLAGQASLFPTDVAPYGLDPYGNPIVQPQFAVNAGQQRAHTSFVEDVSVDNLGGLFAVVSQTSPTGGKDFEDMALVDPSDPEQWLLVVGVDRGDQLDIYRKLYRRGD